MNSFFRELKQRKVYRVALGYAVVAWLVALGFPVALVLAWAFELKGGVIERTPESAGALPTANKRRVWLLAVLGLVISAIALGGYSLSHPWRNIWTAKSITASTASESSTVAAPAVSGRSIAVLPFANLSARSPKR